VIGSIYSPARGPISHRLPQRLRHALGAAPSARRGRVDQYAKATLGSQWNERHEGARQRRNQPLGAGRVVGEAYTPEVGWALGDGREHGDDLSWDAEEADALYDLLEREVIPDFYTRGENGISTAWVKRMRESMAQLTPRFSTNRTCANTRINTTPCGNRLPEADGQQWRDRQADRREAAQSGAGVVSARFQQADCGDARRILPI